MDLRKCTSSVGVPSVTLAPSKFSIKVSEKNHLENVERDSRQSSETEVDVDLREVYFLLLHFLSSGPCKKTFSHFLDELLEHQLLPRRYHSCFSRGGVDNKDAGDDDISFPLTYAELAERYPHIERDHLVKLLKQLMMTTSSSLHGKVGRPAPNAADVPTLLGTGSFSLLDCCTNMEKSQAKLPPAYLHWPHMQAGQIRALSLREIGGGFTKHHRAPSIRSACYAIAKPSTLLEKMQNIKKLRGHRNAVYCAIFDRSGRYVITGSDDRLVKVWSMETALCLASCRGHEGDITDLAVSSNNAVVASASNDFVIRVWRLPDGMPVSVLQGHTGAVTAIAFSPRPNAAYHLLSSSDDGTCRIWEARSSHLKPRIYQPKPSEAFTGKSSVSSNNGSSSINGTQSHQILCCAYNADGTVFVTGSSDTFARVWSALKSNTDDPERPVHEMDVLSGHEDDVNYVQFSGCPVASKSSLFDSLKEESIPKFKNSWFCHDNIVTCSRDGSAIIWIPKSRRSHGKVGRWTRAYHLKVPPPPLPPQPARGGPRQRFLPTPRGVNMIVCSLDNRFVLAAIMDCRICVWNAVDGSLVHSLTGHTASSYVLDVHPFNPRIAMSAGYDGRTIVWDIWEGTPVRIYSMGDFKLVDGKFSADGTSIVLSDDVGQIYLINTGEGELQKDAKYDQFFLGDYRPVIRDASGGVLDQETQLSPYQRNIQDPLCDSSMMPYPEPYQTAYQQRRLGALGIEWRPSTMKIAIDPENSLGLDYLMPPLPDLERIIEPLPEFVDATFWEPENEVLSEDSDSEYNMTEENSSEGEKARSIASSTSDSEFSAENGEVGRGNKDGLRRSRRKKHKLDSLTSSGRRVKKRSLNESAGTSSVSYKSKKPKIGRRISKKKSSKATTLRPKRLAACNARNMLSQIRGTSSDGEDEFGSEHDSSDSDIFILQDSEHDPSDNELVLLEDSKPISNEPDFKFQNMHRYRAKEKYPSSNELEETAMPSQIADSQPNLVKKGRLVLKLSLRDRKKEVPPKDAQPKCDREPDLVTPSSTLQTTTKEKRILKFSVGTPPTLAEATDVEPSEEHNKNENADIRQLERAGIRSDDSMGDREHETTWGEVKMRTSRYARSGDVPPVVSPCLDDKQCGINELENRNDGTKELDSLDYALKSSLKESASPLGDDELRRGVSIYDNSNKGCEGPSTLDHSNEVSQSKHSDEKENVLRTSTKIRIKTKTRILADPRNPSKLKFVAAAKEHSPGDDLTPENHPHTEDDDLITELDGPSGDFPKTFTDAVLRTRSYNIKATSHEANIVKRSIKVRGNYQTEGTSRGVEESSRNMHDQLARRSRAARNYRGQTNNHDDQSSSSLRILTLPVGKLSWLMLSEYEDGYRYIPQLGDEVVYLRQGHQEFAEISRSRECPLRSLKGNLNAVEVCKVDALDYTWGAGSGESCCKIKLKLIDPCSNVLGKSLTLTLPELKDFSDFVVEKALYDAAIKRNWTTRDRCHVWWRNQNGEGGEWWNGRVVSTQAKSTEFPDSPWLRYQVQYKDDSSQIEQHNPWELCDFKCHILSDRPRIEPETRDKLLHYFRKLEDKELHIIQQMNQAVHKSDYCNRFAAPLYPELIKSRLKNDYYRSLEAVKNDIRVMFSNSESYFVRRDSTARIASISQWLTKKLSRL